MLKLGDDHKADSRRHLGKEGGERVRCFSAALFQLTGLVLTA